MDFGIIGFIAVGVVIIAAIAIACLLLMRRVDRKPRPRIVSERSIEEWEGAVGSYDPDKGVSDTLSESDAYKACSKVLSDIIGAVGKVARRPVIEVSVGGYDEAASLDPLAYIRDTLDLDDTTALMRGAENVANIYADSEQQLDAACCLAYSSQDSVERRACAKALDAAYGLLEPGVEVRLSYDNPDTGAKSSISKRISMRDMAALTRISTAYADTMPPSIRRKAMEPYGFRCLRCGKSAVVGARLRLAKDAKGSDVVLCDSCRN